MLVTKFIKLFSETLTTHLKARTLDKFARACEHALNEACGKQLEMTPANYSDISKIFFAKIAILVKNRENRHGGGAGTAKVHWISTEAGMIAEATLQSLYDLHIKPKTVFPAYTAFRASTGTSASSSTSTSSVPAPTPAPAPGTVASPATKSTTTSTKISTATTDERKTSADTALFKSNDYNYAGYSETEVLALSWAENCCAFPKLALHLSKQQNVSIRAITIAINKHIETSYRNKTPESLSPKEVMETYEAHKSSFSLR